MKAARTILGAILVCLTVATPTHARVVTWELTATFDDGGRATGSFQFDNDKFQMSRNGLGIFDIVTTRGGKLAGTEYATGVLSSEGDATPFAMNITNDLGHLSFLHRLPLSDAGGIVSLDGGTEEFGILASRSVVRGELIGQVPEASQLIFLLIGAAGIVAAVFRIQEGEIPRELHPTG